MWTIDLRMDIDFQRSISNETTSFVTVTIARNPKICNGRPTIFGTRIAVSNIVELHFLLGWDVQRILDEYPYLNKEQVIAALEYYQQNTREIDEHLKKEFKKRE